jgi:hypothetical protein
VIVIHHHHHLHYVLFTAIHNGHPLHFSRNKSTMSKLLPLLLLPLLLVCFVSKECLSLSARQQQPNAASVTRARLVQAFSSPSGKLTFSPEIVIPEPKDSTSILLQSNAIQGLSSRIRASKANSVFLKGSMTALQTFCIEQEASRGSFPGPVPAIYFPTSVGGQDVTVYDFSAIAEAGADGVLVPVCAGKEVSIAQDLTADSSNDDSSWIESCHTALKCGVQPIPEITMSETVAANLGEDGMNGLVDTLCLRLGEDPVAVLVTVNPTKSKSEETDSNNQNDEKIVSLPTIPKPMGKRIPILGSVRAQAGDNRLGIESMRFKDAGFTGAVLRSECLPGYRAIQLDLDIVGKFWAGCITDLKSTKSKSFSFRSKNNMEQSAATKWGNFQKSIMDSGALGDPSESYSVVDDSKGEYKCFA